VTEASAWRGRTYGTCNVGPPDRDYSGMATVLVLATAGAGGDLQPLAATAVALRALGHRLIVVGDASARTALDGLDLETLVLDPSLDLGPRLVHVVQEAMSEAHGEASAAGGIVRDGMRAWAEEVAAASREALTRLKPDLIVTSLFGVEAVDLLEPACPWVVINSTFALGATSGRPLRDDVSPRALALLSGYAELLSAPDIVLHATDRVFDLGGRDLPAHHRYVGPLGIWEQPLPAFPALDEPGEPWVLATISTQTQDDMGLADVVLRSLARTPVRVLMTLGSGHAPSDVSEVPSNARIASLVSHTEVLERAVLFVGHAGHGSVMKALWWGRPMVLVPWGRDQPGVAARAKALGVSIVVPREELTADSFSAAVVRALADEDMRRTAEEHSIRLQATDPPAEAARLLGSLLS
jgi:hypothetical protein